MCCHCLPKLYSCSIIYTILKDIHREASVCCCQAISTTLNRNMPCYKQQFANEVNGTAQHATAGYDVPSNLTSQLLLAACTCNISFAVAQDLAHAAFLDGANHPNIIAMGQTGTWGQYPSHVKQHLQTQFFKSVAYALPTTVNTSVRNTNLMRSSRWI